MGNGDRAAAVQGFLPDAGYNEIPHDTCDITSL